MKTNVYIDGFNFYYGCVKGTKYKWVDFLKLCQILLPEDNIHRIRYFTAKVSMSKQDPDQPARQKAYLRALRTIPILSVHCDKFRIYNHWRPYVEPEKHRNKAAFIQDTREKGTDVNLASYLLMDGFNGEYEKAVLISNDSDFKLPVKFVRDELKLKITVYNPDRKRKVCYALRSVASSYEFIFPCPLYKCQFSPNMKDEHGDIIKPDSW